MGRRRAKQSVGSPVSACHACADKPAYAASASMAYHAFLCPGLPAKREMTFALACRLFRRPEPFLPKSVYEHNSFFSLSLYVCMCVRSYGSCPLLAPFASVQCSLRDKKQRLGYLGKGDVLQKRGFFSGIVRIQSYKIRGRHG